VLRGHGKEALFWSELLQLNYTGAGASSYSMFRFVASLALFLASLAEKRKERESQKKERERKKENREKRKNRLFNFLEIVIDNLYLLYYYQVIKIEDVNYIMK
jgi:hypothetical protein